MFDLEKAITEWKRTMRRSPSIDDGDLADLDRYLRDKVEDSIRRGSGAEEAFKTAEAEFRRAGALDAAYGHARAARLGGRFPWRPRRFSPGLLRSYVRTSVRRLRFQKAHSLINIGGLALGLAACLLAFLWVQDEIGYDRFQERADSIAQIYSVIDGGGSRNVHMGSYYPLAAELKARCQEVVDAARVALAQRLLIRSGDRVFNTDVIALADPSIFEIFTFSFLRGNAATALADKYAAVLTESMARRYFGDQDPVGRTLRVNGEFDVHVSAVIKDIPSQSSLRFDGIVPFVLQFAPSFEEPTQWGGNPLETWVLLSPGADQAAVEGKITAIAAPHFAQGPARVDFRLHPLLRKRLHSPEGNSLIRMVLLFAGGALFVLALACINFTNLSTAAAAALMGFTDPVGQRLKIFRSEGTVVGVVRDFHFRPLRHAIRPIVYGLRPSSRSWAVVRIAPGTSAPSLRTVVETVKRIDPDTLFEPVFFDDRLVRSQYFVEQKIWTVANFLTATSVFIACIGLFGLALFMTQRRTKEIGVRKVMGASAAGLAAKLAMNFLAWVAFAVVLAFPPAYWASHKILAAYAYRAPLGIGLFVLPGLAVLTVAGLTVGIHTLRAAGANPVESLRYE